MSQRNEQKAKLPDVSLARASIHHTALELTFVAKEIDDEFARAIEIVMNCYGNVVVSGVGKSGHIAKKISSTFCSIGVSSYFLHAADAMHGELGGLHVGDVLIVLSNSGETQECVGLAEMARQRGVEVVGITSHRDSSLAKSSSVTIATGPIQESFTRGPVPTTSAVAAMCVGDAIAVVLSHRMELTKRDVVLNHPGGHIGSGGCE